MTIGIAQAALDLSVAVALGAVIGFERQWRQRLAGLRTNTLVALGAAFFEVFENLFPSVGGSTRVAAQVVSGIGFLGAGIIFREGVNVRGLNTAATLWCSAAVGLLAGAGALAYAALALHRLESSNIEDSDRVEVLAALSAERRSDGTLEQIVGRLSLEPSVTAARWRVEAITE